MKVLKIVGMVLAGLVVLLGIAYLLRSDPIGPIAGKRLSGDEAAYPSDWSACAPGGTAAIEVRPDDPHSVTTVCVRIGDDLIVPAMNGGEKRWPAYATADPRVRVKLGGVVYPARAVRATDITPEAFASAMQEQFPDLAGRAASEGPPPDVWLFRIEPR